MYIDKKIKRPPNRWSLIFLLAAIFLCILINDCQGVTSPGTSVSSCHELGFTDALLCSTCKDFAEFVGDSVFNDECSKCCSEESQKVKKTYQSVSLVVFRYENGANPRLTLLDSEGKKEDINIESWKIENLEEYLVQNNFN
ncbi:hypothetical protein RB653_007647 [Dictyostelium firmibasis]|uniref:Selenoprotein F n=1 Tax=Dictyostelium firmibasis TaxID=79012 RepID=A0AAN7TVZ1_9MYCE